MSEIDSGIEFRQLGVTVKIAGDDVPASCDINAKVGGDIIGVKTVETDDIFASKAYVRIAGATKALKLRGIPVVAQANYYWKYANAYSPVSSDEVWSLAYSAWESAGWIYGGNPFPFPSVLNCRGGFYNQASRWVAEIFTDRWDIIFRPVNFITEAEWNLKSSPLTLIMPRAYIPTWVDPEEGGAIECMQTGEVEEQIVGNLVFSIPKGITDYNEFSLTMKGLNRNIGDLKHSSPVWGQRRYKGCHYATLNNIQIL